MQWTHFDYKTSEYHKKFDKIFPRIVLYIYYEILNFLNKISQKYKISIL